LTHNKFPEKTIHIDGVGNILFRHRYRARRPNISTRPFVSVRVFVPFGMSYINAVRFVTERKLWIVQHLNKIREFEKLQTHFDENLSYYTKHHKLHLRTADRTNISVRISGGEINVAYPTELNSKSKEVQAAIRKGIEQSLKIEAKQNLPDKVKVLADKFSFKYNKLSLKNIKSRWGSCSRKNNINLSIHLMRLPDHLIDYVILHELVHTVHHNHGAGFWNLLNDVSGGAKILDKELRKYRLSIF
jgi:predicted metal-dependent hydrolase